MKLLLNNRRNKLLFLGLVTLLGIALEAFIFSAAGPFMRLGNIDLNFLVAPLILVLVLFVLSAVIPIVLVNRFTLLFSTAIQYFALTVFTFLIFQRSLLFSRLPFLTHRISFLNSLSDSAAYLALFWVGLGFYTLSNLVIPTKKGLHFHRPLFSMLGFLTIGIALWKALDVFGVYWNPLRGAGFVIGFSLVIVALTRLIAYITSPVAFFLTNLLRWLLENPVKLFWFAILVMSYFIFARPLIYTISPYAYLIEWVVVCFAGYQILSSIKNNLKVPVSQPLAESEWKKHQQIVQSISDDDFTKMVVLQEEFIQTGTRRNLLLFLRQMLVNNGIQDDRISALLQPVIEYSDSRTRWYNRWFLKKRLIQVNRSRRAKVLEDAMNRIKDIIYPTGNFKNGAAHA
jgi:hypothetical protein